MECHRPVDEKPAPGCYGFHTLGRLASAVALALVVAAPAAGAPPSQARASALDAVRLVREMVPQPSRGTPCQMPSRWDVAVIPTVALYQYGDGDRLVPFQPRGVEVITPAELTVCGVTVDVQDGPDDRWRRYEFADDSTAELAAVAFRAAMRVADEEPAAVQCHLHPDGALMVAVERP